MKTKYTKQQIAQLNKMNGGAFYIDKKSLFERIYDYMSNLINGKKSIAPAELKSF